jgi:hypothetical protein
MQREQEHASYLSAIVLRIASTIVIEVVAAAAYFAGVIHVTNLIGISISVGFNALLCIPFWFVMKDAREAKRPTILTLVDRFLALIAYSGVIYSLGGIEATYLIPIYVIFMIYYVVVDRKMLYITAAMSLVCFSSVVLLDMFGVLPHLAVNPGFKPRPFTQAAIIAVIAVLLYVSAFTASYAAKIIERGSGRAKSAERRA